jgi:phosphoglycolate phosphatase
MKQKELIIFDMDGTLIDSGDVITNTINFVRGHLGLKEIEKHLMLEQLNNPDINSSEYFYGTSEFTSQQTELFTEYYNENCVKDIKLYDGIEELLNSLQKDFQLTIATNASRDFAVKMVEHLGIDKYFDIVIGASCVDKPKPHPDMVLKTLNDLQVHHHKSILIGDSLKDIRAAQAANVDSILVNWGFSNHENHDTIRNSNELYEKLCRLK